MNSPQSFTQQELSPTTSSPSSLQYKLTLEPIEIQENPIRPLHNPQKNQELSIIRNTKIISTPINDPNEHQDLPQNMTTRAPLKEILLMNQFIDNIKEQKRQS